MFSPIKTAWDGKTKVCGKREEEEHIMLVLNWAKIVDASDTSLNLQKKCSIVEDFLLKGPACFCELNLSFRVFLWKGS